MDDSQPNSSKSSKQPAKKSSGGDGDETSFQLENNRYVKVREFRGKVYVDIREFYEKDGELLPGKKGTPTNATTTTTSLKASSSPSALQCHYLSINP